MKGNDLYITKMATVLVRKYGPKYKHIKIAHKSGAKLALCILWRIYKGRTCAEQIFHIFKIQHVFF